MKRLGLAAVAASGLAAALFGFAGPAQAEPDAVTDVAPIIVPAGINHHHDWLDHVGPHVIVPQLDANMHQSR
jgi:hypothetical protein